MLISVRHSNGNVCTGLHINRRTSTNAPREVVLVDIMRAIECEIMHGVITNNETIQVALAQLIFSASGCTFSANLLVEL
jgi:hypothetical protein